MFNKQDIYMVQKKWGKEPYCNNKSEHAAHINNYCFPLFCRCFSLSLGLIITYLTLSIIEYMTTLQYSTTNLIISLIGCLPTIIDGILQYYYEIQSTNFRRCTTGLIIGISLAFVVSIFFNFISSLL